MFCKNCGTQVPDGFLYCPKCGTKTNSKPQNPGKAKTFVKARNPPLKHMAIILVSVLAITIIAGFWLRGGKGEGHREGTEGISLISSEDGTMNGAKKGIVQETETQVSSTAAAKELASLDGVWKCEKGEVIFTQDGHMMLGKDGIILGAGWVDYEVVDDSNLYVSGGDIPVGMNIGYSLDGDYLQLELNTGNIIFTREE